jgi:spore coat protein CotF
LYTDREMTLDVLEIAKAGAVSFTQAATETSSPAIRQALIQMRSQCEQAQQMLGQYAQSKNFYKPAPAAPSQDVSEINQFLQQSVAQSQML